MDILDRHPMENMWYLIQGLLTKKEFQEWKFSLQIYQQEKLTD